MATEYILKHYDSYMSELATVKERQSDRSAKYYVDLKQAIALKLLEKIQQGNDITFVCLFDERFAQIGITYGRKRI